MAGWLADWLPHFFNWLHKHRSFGNAIALSACAQVIISKHLEVASRNTEETKLKLKQERNNNNNNNKYE